MALVNLDQLFKEIPIYNESQEKIKKQFDPKARNLKTLEEEWSNSNEEYLKKVNALRQKVVDLQKKKQESFKNIARSRNNAKQALLKAVNPIVKKYMEDNSIRLVLDKKAIILGDTTLEITDKIIKILNQQVSSLKFN
jgi:Skp family chaperone for outer membrane proteins